MIVGISGKINSGKDIVAAMLQYKERKDHNISLREWLSLSVKERNERSGWTIVRFADKLKDIVCLLIGCTREQLEDRDFKETSLGADWIKYEVFNMMTDIATYIYDNEEEAQATVKRLSNLCDGCITFNYRIVEPTPRLMLQHIGTELFRDSFHPNTWVNATMRNYTPYSNWIIPDVRFLNEANAIKKKNGLLIRIINDKEDTLNNDHRSEIALDNYKDWDCRIVNDKKSFKELYDIIKEI